MTRSTPMTAVVDRPSARPTLTPERAKVLAVVAFRPAGCAVALTAAAILVTLVAAGSDLTGTAGAIAAGWLALHQVPLTIGGATLGALPLLPTAGLLWFVARGCAKAAKDVATHRERLWIGAAAVGGPFVVTIVALAVIADASEVIALQPPNTLAAIAWVLGLQATAAGLGVASTLWRDVELPHLLSAALPIAGRALLRLLAAACVLTLICLLASWSDATAVLTDGFVGGLSLVLLSLAYLPNVVVGAGAVLTGAGAEIGSGSVGLFGVVGGPVPGLPVLAAVPSGPAAAWWPIGLVVIAGVAVAAGRECARTGADRATGFQVAVVTGVLVGVAFSLLCWVAGGQVGEFGRIGADVAFAGLFAAGWTAAIAAATVLVLGGQAPADEAVSSAE